MARGRGRGEERREGDEEERKGGGEERRRGGEEERRRGGKEDRRRGGEKEARLAAIHTVLRVITNVLLLFAQVFKWYPLKPMHVQGGYVIQMLKPMHTATKNTKTS